MKWLLTHRAWQDYQDAPASVQKAFDKQVGLLAENLRHPSLRAKKYDQANDIWQARINRDWRFYFQVEGTPTRLSPLFLIPNSRPSIGPQNNLRRRTRGIFRCI
jgi:mRNA interferase RelE/StbE